MGQERATMLGAALASNLLALPSTLEDQAQQAELYRSLLGPTTGPGGQQVAGVFTPEQLDVVAPQVQRFPGADVPVLGSLLKGVGETGQLLQTALTGRAPDAPRIPPGTLVQVQNLRSQQAQRQGMLGLASTIADPRQRQLYEQLVEAGDTKTAMRVAGFDVGTRAPTIVALSIEQAQAELGPDAPRLQILKRAQAIRNEETLGKASALAPVQIERAAASAAAGATARGRVSDRRDREQQQREQEQLEDFRRRNPLGGRLPGNAARPGRQGVGVSLIADQGAGAGTDALAGMETRRTESPTNTTITRITPPERVEARKALQEAGEAPANPDGSYSEAQMRQYLNAVKGSEAQATALGGLTPDVIDARARDVTARGRAEVLPLSRAIDLGVPPGTTVAELRAMEAQGTVDVSSRAEVGADARKQLKRVRSARAALSELADATSVLTTSPAVALSRLQGIGLEMARLGGDPRAAAISAAAVVTPSIRKALGDTGNMSGQEQQITFDAVIPSSADTQASAQNKLLFMDNLLRVLEEELSADNAGPGVRERIVQTLEPLDPDIRQKLDAARSGGEGTGGDGRTITLPSGKTIEVLP